MGVQASAARLYLNQDLKISSQALEQIESAAAAAVRELQSILHTLRSDESSQESEPIASLTADQIPALIAEAQSSGLFITFTTVGSATRLPQLVSLSLYRITQEALTNVLRHCGAGTEVSVTLRYLSHLVEIEIYNLRPPKRIVNSSGSGLGIIGMRERVEVLGGKLEASSLSQGGFLVRAAIPLREETS